ncbi:MAG: hypothetical protein NVS1B10_03620 [Candidatus Saccharimonadales bacterium]
MLSFKKSSRKGSARTQIDIEAVEHNTLKLSGGRYCRILRVNSINFELKSEAEQDAIIDTYESFLNSVGCPLQILMRTREIDMERYLHELGDRLQNEPELIYKNQLLHYNGFIRRLVQHNKILTRQFFVVVRYDASGTVDTELIAEQLDQHVDIVTKGFSRLGIHAQPLSDLAILDLFYSFYSPAQAKRQPLTERALQLLHSDYITREVTS